MQSPAQELSYILITPHSIRKSRTGGILSRLISRSGLDLVAARVFAPSDALIERYADSIVSDDDERHRHTQQLVRDYIRKNFGADADGNRPRVMMLVLRGEDAVAKVRRVTGHLVYDLTAGETIRDTYGDYISENGNVIYFEPAALAPQSPQAAEADLKLWAAYSDSDGGVLDHLIPPPESGTAETTLVLLKPDNFRFPNVRPGALIETFSRTGLAIVGVKVLHMSVAEAEEFYRPVLDALLHHLADSTGRRVRLAIEDELGCPLNDEIESNLSGLITPLAARAHWESIIQFMAGRRPSQCPPELRDEPGTEKCFALLYHGVNAVAKIRSVLGPTDPAKAPTGTIRKEFGQSVMVNAAHASDSVENAKREISLLNIAANNFKPLIESHHAAS